MKTNEMKVLTVGGTPRERGRVIGESLREDIHAVMEKHEQAIDIGKFRGASGLITLDYGFKNTGSTKSSITFLDGEKGILRYRGYPIEQLAENSNFLEVAYLLIYGELPTEAEFGVFNERIYEHTLVHEDIKKILDGFPS